MILLDIRVNDQAQTHRLLKDGEVMGCISTIEQPMQGCRIEYIGRMNYRMMAAPEFAARWFPDGLAIEVVRRAPAIIFDRQVELHHKLLHQTLEEVPSAIQTNYVPSVEKFSEFIALGLAYGMLPDQQSSLLIGTGQKEAYKTHRQLWRSHQNDSCGYQARTRRSESDHRKTGFVRGQHTSATDGRRGVAGHVVRSWI